MNLMRDSPGFGALGEGECQARKHGVPGRRQWRKVPLVMEVGKSRADSTCDTRGAMRAMRHDGRAFRKRGTKDHARSRTAAGIWHLTPCGGRIAARDPDRLVAAIRICFAPGLRVDTTGIVRVA